MEIATSVRLTPSEESRLCAILRCEQDQLSGKVAELGKAAIREYLDMLLSEVVIRNPEVREHRLHLLITETFSNSIPTEAEVSRLFNLSSTAARSLLRSVVSRHRHALGDVMKLEAVSVISSCELCENGDRRVAIRSSVLVDFLNDLLSEVDGSLMRLSREKMTNNYYIVPEDSFNALQDYLS
jgi:hypothetical protein